jgi:hypothetical protein
MDWFKILEKARKFCPNQDSTFTVSDIEQSFKFKPGDKTTTYQIASGWVGKLVKWKYVARVGSRENGDRKPIALYAITEKGRLAKNTSTSAGFDDLREAVRGFETARTKLRDSMGKKTQRSAIEEEQSAYEALIALCNKIDEEEFRVE